LIRPLDVRAHEECLIVDFLVWAPTERDLDVLEDEREELVPGPGQSSGWPAALSLSTASKG
jgi:hypothetical protein